MSGFESSSFNGYDMTSVNVFLLLVVGPCIDIEGKKKDAFRSFVR